MASRLQQLKESCERAAAEHKAREEAIAAVHHGKLLRARFAKRYGYDPMTNRPDEKSPAVVTRQGHESIHLVVNSPTRIEIYVHGRDQ